MGSSWMTVSFTVFNGYMVKKYPFTDLIILLNAEAGYYPFQHNNWRDLLLNLPNHSCMDYDCGVFQYDQFEIKQSGDLLYFKQYPRIGASSSDTQYSVLMITARVMEQPFRSDLGRFYI